MAIVSRGLGQPEDGALVAGGLGLSVTVFDPNAASVRMSGSSSMTATLTAATTRPRRRGGTIGAQRYVALRPRIDVSLSIELPMVPAFLQLNWMDDDEALMMLA